MNSMRNLSCSDRRTMATEAIEILLVVDADEQTAWKQVLW